MKKETNVCKRKGWKWSGQKQLVMLMVVLLLALSGCAGGSSSTAPESKSQETKPVELRLAHFFPSTHPVETQLVQPWAKEIAQATQGRVKISSYPGQTLLKADATYDGVRSGQADIGISCFSYTRGMFPVLEVFELPGITYLNSKVASQVAWEVIKELNPQEIQDTKLLMVMTTGPGDLYTKDPVKKLADLKGMSIRATGLSAKTLERLGASPAAMPQSDAYEALSKGVVKGNLGPIEVLQGWKQAEVTKYITKTPFLYNTLFFVTMNQDQWNALSPVDQKAIENVSEKVFTEVAAELWDKQNESALNGAIKQNNMEIITLPQAESEQWIKKVMPIQNDYVSRMEEQGIKGQDILNQVMELADKYNQQYK